MSGRFGLTPDVDDDPASEGVNPYAVGVASTAITIDNQWPQIKHRDARRVRQLARDARRARWSMLGCLFLGMIGPMIFTLFFWGHLSSHRRLTRRYPDVLSPEVIGSDPESPEVARDFATAENVFRRWRRGYFFVTLVIAILYTLFITITIRS